jgi:hypothetical protein
VFRRGARGLRIARHCDCFDHQRADFQTSWRRIPSFYLRHQERIMSTSPQNGKPDASQNADDEAQSGSDETFTTDVSETDDEGTTVREAEVRADDLSEVKPADGDKS